MMSFFFPVIFFWDWKLKFRDKSQVLFTQEVLVFICITHQSNEWVIMCTLRSTMYPILIFAFSGLFFRIKLTCLNKTLSIENGDYTHVLT